MRSKMMMTLALVAIAGLTACAGQVSDAALCDETIPLAETTRTALLDRADDVPDQVGEAVTPLLIALFAGCSPHQ